MTKIAVWCRHQEDNIIGIGPNIPWHISSDFKRFKRITENKTLVAGQTTYESFPNKTLPNRDIFVLTFDEKYKVSDPKRHFVSNDINDFRELEENLFIVGGASVYKAFLTGKSKLMPDVIVDSKYMGELNLELKGDSVDITPCIEVMEKKYRKITPDYEEDNILTSIWVRKNEFVDQEVLKELLKAIDYSD